MLNKTNWKLLFFIAWSNLNHWTRLFHYVASHMWCHPSWHPRTVSGRRGVGRKEKKNVSAAFVVSDTKTHNSILCLSENYTSYKWDWVFRCSSSKLIRLVYPMPYRKESFKKHYEGDFMIHIIIYLHFLQRKRSEFSVGDDTNSSWSFVLKLFFEHRAFFSIFCVKTVASNRIKY